MQIEEPLHVWVEQAVSVQVIAVPTHCPDPLHWSLYVHALLSEQAVPAGAFAITQVEVPLHVLVWQVELVQVTAVPTHEPVPLQWSLYVQALPSSQDTVLAAYVAVQLDVPLQLKLAHVVLAGQVTAVPWHAPEESQVSLYVHALPSSHTAPVFTVLKHVLVSRSS